MGATPVSLLVALVLQMTSGQADVGQAGRVITAPHGGYDQSTEYMARAIGDSLGWGWVRAVGYRSYPLRYWYDVNRPSERPWRYGSFADSRDTTDGHRIYDLYQERVRRAARRSGAVDMLVEVHGHSRSVTAGGRRMSLQVIELATTGFTRAQLRRLKARYTQLLASVPTSQQVPLAVDRIDSRYNYRGWSVPFYFYANAAKRTGSLRSTQARQALHFELPPRVRGTSSARRAYQRLLATLVSEAANGAF